MYERGYKSCTLHPYIRRAAESAVRGDFALPETVHVICVCGAHRQGQAEYVIEAVSRLWVL